MSLPAPRSLPVAAPALRGGNLALSATLAALSSACGFAAVAASAYAGQRWQHGAIAIYALYGAGTGAGCAVVQMLLRRQPQAFAVAATEPTPVAIAPHRAAPPASPRTAPSAASPARTADIAVPA